MVSSFVIGRLTLAFLHGDLTMVWDKDVQRAARKGASSALDVLDGMKDESTLTVIDSRLHALDKGIWSI